jgi:hypothetical protein
MNLLFQSTNWLTKGLSMEFKLGLDRDSSRHVFQIRFGVHPLFLRPRFLQWFLVGRMPSACRSLLTFIFLFFTAAQQPPSHCATASLLSTIHDHTQRRATVGRTPLDEWSARRRDLYLTTHTTLTTHKHPFPGGIRTHNLSRRAAADPHLRPRGQRDRRLSDVLRGKKRKEM